MKTQMNQIKKSIKENRWEILKGILIYGVVCAVMTVCLQMMNLWWLTLIPLTLMSFMYLQNIHSIVGDINAHKAFSFKDFFKLPQFNKRSFIAFFSYIVWAVMAFFVLRLLSMVPQLGLFLVAIMIGIFAISNAISSDYLQASEDQSYFQSVQRVFKQPKVFGFSFLKSITTLVQGVIITVCINVFIFGPQIQNYLQLPLEESEMMIRRIFSNNISSAVQAAGVQVILFYIIFVSALIYSNSQSQKHIKTL